MDSNNAVVDRETGASITIHYPSFEGIPERFIPVAKDRESLYSNKLVQLLKCLSIIASLPEDALEETIEDLEGIRNFYDNRIPSDRLPVIAASNIKGKLGAVEVRTPVALEP
ncbi:hypothetical protein [Chamaesiphon sp.]|uniref:hypothetical protein n=1 Tax=Chamaesiphon sp. TaxID=2814140 RepID=UPI0035938430